MFADQRHEVFWLSLPTSTPVLLPAVLLLQALQDPTHLERQTCWYTSKQVGWQTEGRVIPAAMSCRMLLMR